MNEIDLVVQRRQKPNSSEIETNLMQPNDAFWRFISEVQPTDLRSCCFSEGKNLSSQELGDFFVQNQKIEFRARYYEGRRNSGQLIHQHHKG